MTWLLSMAVGGLWLAVWLLMGIRDDVKEIREAIQQRGLNDPF